MLTKKDFICLAEILKIHAENERANKLNYRELVQDIARWCELQNPNFNYPKFWDACEVDVKKEDNQ